MRISSLTLVFWGCIGAVAYNYAGYPLVLFGLSVFSQAKSDVLFLLRRKARRCSRPAQYCPRVALLMSAYNEEQVIEAKIKNCFELDYPHGGIEFLIGLDAPTDSTPQLLNRFQSSRMRVIRFPERQGKLKVLCALARQTSAEIVVITDANTMLDCNCIRNLVRHFADPHVGAVSGEETRIVAQGTDPSAESLYWRYESALKFLENRLNCFLAANGSVLAVRRTLFHPSKSCIVEDLQIPLEIRFQGHRVVYDPEAVATEEIAPTASAQFARRVRLGTGDFQALFANLACLHPRHGLLAFCYFSHRVLRWLAPVLLPVALFCSVLMVQRPAYAALVGAQCGFYVAALLGYWRKKRRKPAGVFSVPLHFCLMNLALLLGLGKYLTGHQSLVWKSTPRTIRDEVG
jgi:cellulose synthase/poly-beta-1,6-N-acetylglucosamine synthase-like glycosyltransferase